MDEYIKRTIIEFQKNEITEHIFYDILAKKAKGENAKILMKISRDELRHYHEWKKYSGKEVKPCKFTIFKYLLISKIFGLTFAIKMMEKGEEKAEKEYEK